MRGCLTAAVWACVCACAWGGCCMSFDTDIRDACGSNPGEKCEGYQLRPSVSLAAGTVTPCSGEKDEWDDDEGWAKKCSDENQCGPDKLCGRCLDEPATAISSGIPACLDAKTACFFIETSTYRGDGKCTAFDANATGIVQNTQAEYELAHHSMMFAGKMLLMFVMLLDFEASWVAFPHAKEVKGAGHSIAFIAGLLGTSTTDVQLTMATRDFLYLVGMLTFVILTAEGMVALNNASGGGTVAIPYHPDGIPDT